VSPEPDVVEMDVEPSTLHPQTEDLKDAQCQIMASLKEENVEQASAAAAAGSERGTCSLQDLQRELQAAQEELGGVRTAHEATDAGRNVLALWQAQGRVQGEKKARAAVEAQLQCSYERLDAAVQERDWERHAGRHASHTLSKAEVKAGEALRQRMRTKAGRLAHAWKMPGKALWHRMRTKAGARMEDSGEPEDASLTRRRINQLAEHVQVGCSAVAGMAICIAPNGSWPRCWL
jgi:ribosomal protein L34